MPDVKVAVICGTSPSLDSITQKVIDSNDSFVLIYPMKMFVLVIMTSCGNILKVSRERKTSELLIAVTL